MRTAILYPSHAAPASVGDRVVLNTTAVDLDLGTGGADFVVWNLAVDAYDALSGGHIMKLRYTPAQCDVLAVEAPESPDQVVVDSPGLLDLTPVVAASLHSQLLPVVAAIRHRIPTARVAYVMTDGAALPAALSRVVRRMRELEWLCGVVTVGHAFGGDLEAVGIPSGVLAARRVLGADVVVAGMGPGVVGTSTRFGTSALELATIVMAAKAVGGLPVVAVRMSSGDPRERHRGLSHHTVTALSLVKRIEAHVPVPQGVGADAWSMLHWFRVVEVDTGPVGPLLEQAAKEGLEASHMGRSPAEDPLFFAAAGAAGLHAASLVPE